MKHVTRKPSRQGNKKKDLEEDPDKPGRGIHRNTESKRNKKENETYPRSMTEEDPEEGQDKPGTSSARTERRMNRMEYERHTQQYESMTAEIMWTPDGRGR